MDKLNRKIRDGFDKFAFLKKNVVRQLLVDRISQR
jgi:hypothetical protein